MHMNWWPDWKHGLNIEFNEITKPLWGALALHKYFQKAKSTLCLHTCILEIFFSWACNTWFLTCIWTLLSNYTGHWKMIKLSMGNPRACWILQKNIYKPCHCRPSFPRYSSREFRGPKCIKVGCFQALPTSLKMAKTILTIEYSLMCMLVIEYLVLWLIIHWSVCWWSNIHSGNWIFTGVYAGD